MKLALISDIHGNLPALEAVLADIKRQAVDAVINLGDSVSGPLLPLETAHCLMALDCIHVAGNHERQLLTQPLDTMGPSDRHARQQLGAQELAWLAQQPASLPWTEEVFLCHGTPYSDTQYFLETVSEAGVNIASQTEIESRVGSVRSAVIACGHTHIPRSVKTANGQLIVNPGSVGLPAYDDQRPFPHRIETGSPDARYAIIEKKHGAWHAQHITVPYRFEAMARLAMQRGRPNWAIALSTGYMS